MTDRDESIPLPYVDEGPNGLRAVYLRHLRPPEQRILGALVNRFLDLVLELPTYNTGSFGPADLLTATAEDLRFTARYLHHIAAEEQATELQPNDAAVARWAASLAPRVEALADEAEAFLSSSWAQS